MATNPNATQITPPRVPIIDERTGAVSREWYRWFYSLYNFTGSGTGVLPVTSGGTGLDTIPTNGQLLIGNGTGYSLNTLGVGAGISVVNGVGTITLANTGVLSFSSGTTGLSPATTSTGNVTLAGTLIAANGGTGFASYDVGDLLYANTTTTLAKLPDVATGNALISGGVNTAPLWGKIGLTTHVSGVLPIANGGTNGSATPTAYGVAYGTGTAYAFTAAGTAKQVLIANTSAAPTWSTLTSGTSILYGDGLGGFSNVTIGTGVSFVAGTLSATGSGGTVTSVTGTSPVVSSGGTTPAISLAAAYGDTLNPYAAKTANYVLAGPTTGAAAAPTFRALVATDIPSLSYVTSVSFTGGIVTVANPTTTPAFTIAGTSGGVPYFSSTSTWASSAALAANAIVLGGGAGAAPATTTTGTGVVTALGVNTGTAGAFVVNGGALGTPSSGTVTNLTGTASININGTVGATTANTGAFTNITGSANAIIEVTDNTNAALRITQLGTGNALLVEDSSNPDATPFVIDASGNIASGLTSTTLALEIYRTASATFRLDGDGVGSTIQARSFSATAGTSPIANFARARGTKAASTIVQSGDLLAQYRGAGYDGAGFIQAANIEITVDGTPGLNDMPGRLTFSTTADGASVPTERMRITSAGNVGIGVTPVYTLDVAGQARIIQTSAGAATFPLLLRNSDSSANTEVGIDFDCTNNGVGVRTGQITAVTNGSNAITLKFLTSNGAAPVSRFQIDQNGNALAISIGGLGYGTGSGGSVTQGTSRTTGVTLNKTNGAITMFTAVGSAIAATFTVTNSTVAATDTIIVNQKSGTNLYVFLVTAVAAGSFNITFYTTGGIASDAPVINFSVIKAVTA